MLIDCNNRPLRRGVYREKERLSSGNDFYFLQKVGSTWSAKSSSGKRFEVGYPKGLPDSSIMSEGKIDSSDLVYVPAKKQRKLIEELRVQLGFLEKNLAQASEKYEQSGTSNHSNPVESAPRFRF